MTNPCHRLVQATDLHLTADPREAVHGVVTDAGARAVLARIAARRPDALVLSGDLTERAEPAAYHRLEEHLQQLECPVYLLAGNHDDSRIMAEHAPDGRVCIVTDASLGRWRLHFLDSSIAGRPEGQVTDAALAALAQGLSNAPSLVFVHHQPVPVGSPWIDQMGLKNGEQLAALVRDKPAVAALCAGHVHQALGGWQQGVRWLTAPSTCHQAQRFADRYIRDDLPPGFRWFDLYDDGRWETGVEWVAGDC